MTTSIEKDSVRKAYDLVRDDKSEVNWVVLKYEDKRIVVAKIGIDYNEFLSSFNGKNTNLNHK
jgi:hypothetical protein